MKVWVALFSSLFCVVGNLRLPAGSSNANANKRGCAESSKRDTGVVFTVSWKKISGTDCNRNAHHEVLERFLSGRRNSTKEPNRRQNSPAKTSDSRQRPASKQDQHPLCLFKAHHLQRALTHTLTQQHPATSCSSSNKFTRDALSSLYVK